MQSTGTFELIATTGFGLEAVVARELSQLGYEHQQVEDGRVIFAADESAIARANLWLRSASRVLIRLGGFEARDFGALFDETFRIPWEEWLSKDAAFPVRGKSARSQLHSVPSCQGIVKKAIVERLKKSYGCDWFSETGPACAVEVSILKDRVTLALDTTGPGLHKRGYRTLKSASPLKETLAAALVQLSYWNRERPLIDPFCGSGTIAIEAALLGRNIAPGRERTFAAETWSRISKTAWTRARIEAADLAQPGLPVKIIGSDIDAHVLEMARFHAQKAGVAGDIEFLQQPFGQLSSHRKYGCVITNPPYGERSGELSQVEALYREMPRVFKRLEGWSIYVLTSHPDFERLYGRRADRRRKLYNASIECTYYQYLGPRPPWQQPGRDAAMPAT